MWPFEATLCFRVHPHQPAWLLLTLPPAAWLACPALITGSTQQPTNPSNRETRPILCTVWQIIIKSNSSRSQTDSRLKGIHKVQQTLFNSSALKKKKSWVQWCAGLSCQRYWHTFWTSLKTTIGPIPRKIYCNSFVQPLVSWSNLCHLKSLWRIDTHIKDSILFTFKRHRNCLHKYLRQTILTLKPNN